MSHHPRRLLTLPLALVALLAAPAAFPQPASPGAPTPPAAPRTSDKVDGWKAAPDPSDFKGRLRGDLKLTIPIKHAIQAAEATRPGPIIAICDANAFGPRQWGVMNLQTGSYTPRFIDKAKFEDPQISPDGSILVGKVKPEHLRTPGLEIWNFKTGKPLHRIEGQDVFSVPQAVGFAPGDLLLTTLSKHFDGTLTAYNTRTGARAWETRLPAAVEARNTALSPGGRFLAAVYEKGLWLFDTATGNELSNHPLPQPPETAASGSKPLGVAFSPDGEELAALFEHGHGKARLLVWDMMTGLPVVDKVAEAVKDDRWSRRGERKLEFFPGGALLRFSNQVIDRDTGKVVHTIPLGQGGRGVELLRVLASDKVLLINEKDRDNRAAVIVVSLPADQIARAQDIVRSGGKSSDATLPPLSRPDFSAVQVRLDAPAPDPYALKPDLSAGRAAVGVGAIALRPPRPPSGIEHAVKRVIFSGPPANQLAVAYHLDGAFEKDPSRRKTIIDRINLGGGTAAGTLEVPNHAELMDFASDGKLLIIRQGDDRIDLYSIASVPARHVLGFRPYEEDKNAQKVSWAGIVSPEQFLTISNSGRMVLWSVSGAKAIYEIALGSGDPQWGGGFTFSPNRRQLAIGDGQGVTLWDPATGQPLAQLKGPRSGGDHIAFSPDGARLAHFSTRPYPNLRTYDLASGKLTGECALPKETWTGPVAFAGAEHVLVNGCLVDLDKKIAVWRYLSDGFAPKMQGAPDARHWAFVSGRFNAPPALVAFTLPHEDAKKAIASIRAEENIVLKPGMKVSIEASIEGAPDYQKKVLDTLKARCTEAGLIVAEEAQPIRVVATTAQKGSKTIEYDIIGRGRETVTVPEYECRLQILSSNQPIWEVTTAAGGYASSFVHLKQGETAQDQANKANQNPGSGFFLNASIPGTVAKPLDNLGTSRFTLKGITSAPGQ